MIWQTRTLAQFVAATVPVENAGDTNELLEQAKQIGQPAEDTDEQHPTAAENPPGSFERFMGSMANPRRWAGR
jgi:hypothetical protein